MPARASNTTTTNGIGFLLSQLGHRAAALFAELLIPLELTPPLAGIVRMIARQPGLSQQELAQRLNLLPSRVVAFVDDLETRGYLTRHRNDSDRRLYALHLTPKGQELMTELRGVARDHDRQLTNGLNTEQRKQLRSLLDTIAEAQNLTAAVHPGYRALPADEPSPPSPRRPTRQQTR
jgi:DNA-binding MarR family transcriptional regulator